MLEKFSAGKHQLLLIIVVRWVVIISATILVSLNERFWEFRIAETAMYSVLVVFGVFATLSLARIYHRGEIRSYEIGTQLALDLLFMFALFYFSGGASNPFVSFLLFPLVVSAAILGRVTTYGLLLLALLLYASLFLLPDPISNSANMVMDHSAHAGHSMPLRTDAGAGTEGNAFSLHVIGMWVNFAIIAVLVCTVVVMMAVRLQAQTLKINQQREEVLKREQLLGIATEAASVAHHMGTPLSTIAVIVHELRQQLQHQPEQKGLMYEIDILESQVDICKKELAQLRTKTELHALSLPTAQLILPVIAEIRQEFQLLRPQVGVTWRIADNVASVYIKTAPSLRLAILNLLNNAADASPEGMTVDVYLQATMPSSDVQELVVDIQDRGPGIDEQIIQGGAFLVKSSKHDSIGLGLYLSHASINHVNGTVNLINIASVGTLTRIILPVVSR